MDRKFTNVILLGFAFMFVFTAFQTMGNIEKTILDSIKHEDPTYEGDGYTSLAIIYAVLAICNWLAPSVISVTGPKLAMILGAITYSFFIGTFLMPSTWLLYVASAVVGAGAAIIWTGQGSYLILNSDSTTISRNSGIFWAMLQCSMFFGNTFVFFMFQGKTIIDKETRSLVFIVLLVVSAVGILFLLVLRTTVSSSGSEEEAQTPLPAASGPLYALKRAFSLFLTKEMMLLSCTFFYTGVELSFFSGVYSSSIGFTQQLGENAKQLVGMSGIFIGVGEVAGGALFGILGKKTIRWGRDPIVIIGFLIHILAFFLIFLNIPNAAPLGETNDEAFMTSNAVVAILCSLLLGFGDSCYNTQIYSILGGIFPEDSAPAFALFKFTQSLAAAACFFYSSHTGLYIQLGVLVVTGIIGTITFCMVEWKAKAKSETGYNGEIGTSCAESPSKSE
ncbi:UNC93-like protein MFSD11 [Neocloeon triangulifer]|uniref:UNC93-like protein MFSD11 n=1 Tax=Neocloeon triangulifer TaxID=2078957 RepID=UPI00286F99F5|nr:UNC93-like protein MFSD11 [Neocloeon triangulifer]